jgi:DNA-binding FadR family transcriptional regulator
MVLHKHPVTNDNLTRSIVEHLGVAVVSGEYSERNPFPCEADLQRQYSASRVTLREAVKMLAAKGLLRVRAGAGTSIEPKRNWSLFDPDVLRWLVESRSWPDLVTEFTQMRLAIEPGAAALAAAVAGRAQRTVIEQSLERMIAAQCGKDDPLDADIAFHVAVLEASGNRVFAQLTQLIRTAVYFTARNSQQRKGVRLDDVAAHKKITHAIVAGRPEAAADSMRALIQELLEMLAD